MKTIIPAVIVLALTSACASQYGTRAADPASETVGNDERAGAFWNDPAAAATKRTSEWFEANRHRPTVLRGFLKAMPKGGDIHTHASGAVYAESYIEWAADEERCVDMAAGAISEDHYEPCTKPLIPVADLLSDAQLYDKLVNDLSVRYVSLSGKSGHDQFFEAFEKFAGGTRGHQIAELTNRAARQNVAYAEIMLTVGSDITKRHAEIIDDDIDLEADYLKLIAALRPHLQEGYEELDGYEQKTKELLGCGTASAQPGCNVTRRYLQQITRVVNPARVYSQFVYAFEMVGKDPRLVGLNMVAPEDNYVALRDYDLHMRMLGHLAPHYPGVPVTLHAGELTIGLVPPRHLRDHINKAVHVAGARRIGHGVDIFYEDDPQELLRTMDRRDVLVEICLSSNDIILGVKDESHPFMDYLNAGVPVTLATDDEGISRIDLTNEYLRAAVTYELRYETVKELARNSLAYSFLDGPGLWQANGSPTAVDSCADDAAGADSPSQDCRTFLDSSEKARMQWQLERDFRTFEAGFP